MIKGFLLFVLVPIALVAGDLRIGTLNCYLMFSPSVLHRGNVANQHSLTDEQYHQKVSNLVSMVKECEFVGLQEIGGRDEAEDLAQAAGWEWAFSKGRDTYTGEEVGAIYHLPDWTVTRNGRVAELDRTVSKHLLVTAKMGSTTLHFLVVHLIRPIGRNADKHAKQIAVIREWCAKIHWQEPEASIIILGDTNDTLKAPGSSLFGIGTEASELIGYAPTHLDGRNYDRLVLVGSGTWASVAISRPNYGKRPNELLRSIWTDHFSLKATLQLRDETKPIVALP